MVQESSPKAFKIGKTPELQGGRCPMDPTSDGLCTAACSTSAGLPSSINLFDRLPFKNDRQLQNPIAKALVVDAGIHTMIKVLDAHPL